MDITQQVNLSFIPVEYLLVQLKNAERQLQKPSGRFKAKFQ